MAEESSTSESTPSAPTTTIGIIQGLLDAKSGSSDEAAPQATEAAAASGEGTGTEEHSDSTEEAGEGAAAEGEGTAEEDGGEGTFELDPELLKLDPELAKNPKLAERWQLQVDGVVKIVEKAKAEIASVAADRAWYAENLDSIRLMSDWGAGLADTGTLAPTFAQLVKVIAGMHEMSPQDLLAQLPEDLRTAAASGGGAGAEAKPERLKETDFDDPGAYKAYVAAEDRADRADSQLLAMKAELDKLKAGTQKETAAQQQQREFEVYLDSVTASTIKAIAAADNGWKVDRKMIAEAVKALPQLAKDPAKAVRMHFTDQRAKHTQGAAAEKKAPLPAMPEARGGAAAKPAKRPEDMRAIDFINMQKGG